MNSFISLQPLRILRWLSSSTVLFKRNNQGMLYLDRLILGGVLAIFMVVLGGGSYYLWQVKQELQLIKEIKLLEIKNESLTNLKPDSNLNQNIITVNKQSIINFLSINGFTLENFKTNHSHDMSFWEVEGLLDTKDLTSFVTYIDENKIVFKITELSFEKIEEKPEKLRIMLSGYLQQD